MTSPSHLATPNVPLSRAWNTWTADRYVEMSFLPLGVRVTPLVYAASIARVSRFGPGDEVLLGTHAVDGSRVDARSSTHAGTVLDWHYREGLALDLTGGWRTFEPANGGCASGSSFASLPRMAPPGTSTRRPRSPAARAVPAPSRSLPASRRCW